MKYNRLFYLLLFFCLVAPLLVIVRLIDYPQWATGANRVTWMFGDGTAVPLNEDKDWPWPSCFPSDVGLTVLCHDNALWTTYRSRKGNSQNNLGFARIDPATGIGTVWRFPKDVRHIGTTGLATGPNQEVAIVYWANELHKELALGILDREKGWVYTPQIIPNSYGGRLLAASWVSGRLTVIFQVYILEREKNDATAPLPEQLSVWKATHDAGKTDVTRLKIPESLTGRINHYACRAIFLDKAWHLVYEDDSTCQLLYLKDDGTFRMSDDPNLSCDDLSYNAETAAFGITGTASRVFLRKDGAMDLTIDGKAIPLPSPLNDGWESNYSKHWLESGAGGLTRYPFWFTDNEGGGLARRFDGHWLIISLSDTIAGTLFKADLLDEEGNERLSRKLSLATSFESEGLAYGVPISRKEGGFWLVSQEGAYAAFGDDLRRLDPLPISQHLRTEGSWRLDEDTRLHIFEFYWILIGLPVCLLFGVLMAKALRKEIYRGFCWGSTAYLLPTCWAMWKVFPLLR